MYTLKTIKPKFVVENRKKLKKWESCSDKIKINTNNQLLKFKTDQI